MPCFHPMTAYWGANINPKTGRRPLAFSPEGAWPPTLNQPLEIPCGQCVGCRLERSRQWAMRCLHEASLHNDNSFITLTYDNDHLPGDLSLNKRELQLFFKRLRKYFSATKIRYYACGEYGEKTARPHYHAILFGLDFPDKQLYKVRDGNRLYTSEILEKIWGKGFAPIGNVTFESAAYVARYIMKKQTGDKADAAYNHVNDQTGEIHKVQPEFNTMSRRPGIASDWYKQFKGDCYPSDYITVNGQKMRPPRFYDSQLEKEDPHRLKILKHKRIRSAKKNKANNTSERLAVRERAKALQIEKLKRTTE